MNREKLVSLVLYDAYEKDRSDIANLCDAINKIAIAYSGSPICEGDFDDFLDTINCMIDNDKISIGRHGLDINESVSIDEITSREMYFINKVRPTDIQDSVVPDQKS